MNKVIKTSQFKQSFITKHFMNVINNDELSHSYLFSGESGSGKLSVALMITMRLFCNHVVDGLPCGKCNECRRITNFEHPDVVIVQPEGQNIKISQIRYLKSEFAKSGVESSRKVFIIDGADKMTTGAANSLLKFIEEPNGNIVSFLLTNNKSVILPTIISRTQVVEFPSLSVKAFNQELRNTDINPNQFNLLAKITNNLKTAEELNENQWFSKLQKTIGKWFEQLIGHKYESFTIIQTDIMPFIKNHRDKEITINMMIQVWDDVLKVKFEQVDCNSLTFPQLKDFIKKLAQQVDTSSLISIMEIMLKNNILLSNNVNFQNILESSTLKALNKL